MQVPTASQLHDAIEVLKKLGERINTDAAHLMLQLPETRLGNDYARRTEARSIEQLSHVQTVIAQLENWLNDQHELESKHNVPEI
jgi:hypothetical protein